MGLIKGKQLSDAPDGITSGKLNDLAVTTAKIDNLAVTTGKINDLAVTSGKINDLAVTTAKIDNLAVTTGKIGDAAITTVKIAAGALSADAAGRAKIATGFFDSATVTDKFAASSIADGILVEDYILANGTRAFTADQSMGGFKLTSLGTPTATGDAATKGYVDGLVQGLDIKESCRLATAAALPANTPAGSGVGKTLTADVNGALSVDSVAVVVGDRVLVKDEADPVQNGLYTVTQTGDGSNPWILTRATDADEDVEVDAGLFVFIEEGTANSDTGWVLTTNDPITVDTTALTFTQFSSAGAVTGGAGIDVTGQKVSVDLATDPALEFDAGGDTGKLRWLAAPAGGLERTSNGAEVKLNGTSLDKSASGLKSAVPTASDKNQNPTATSGEESSTGLTITSKNAGDQYVGVRVNGIHYRVGDGVKTLDCYFSADGGTTAKSFVTLVAGDTLFWNGVTSGFDLAASDVVEFDYEAN